VNIRRTTRDLLVIGLIALACGALSVSPLFDFAHGLSLDMLTALRWEMFGERTDPAASSAVVVALDEESYQTPPLKGSPTMTWTGEIGRVLTAILDGGAKAVGFDVVFETSIEQSEIPFGEGVLGDKVRGLDRDFLRALAKGSAAGKVLLGEQLRSDQPFLPSQGQRIAVHQHQNIRPLNTFTDSDDIIRRLPLTFVVDGARTPSMALELAARALKAHPEFGQDGAVTLAGYQIPSRVPNTMTLNFEGGANDIPTYSFADLRLCAVKNDKDYFKRQFADKVVVFGTVQDSEDRRLTSKRFTTGLEGARASRCALEQKPVARNFKRSTIAGVYIHATAINNLIARDAIVELARLPIALIAVLAAGLAAIAARVAQPVYAIVLVLAAIVVYAACATVAFHHSLALPLSEPFMAGAGALAIMGGYRFIVSDKDRRLLQKSFALYLAPHVINRMLTSSKLPELGGETRHVTIFFSDLESFSQIAENMSPDALMALMNEYLSEMTDIIESHGGYVDKYIGDSIVAIFGAPAEDRDHAISAARAALDCCKRLEALNWDSVAFQGRQLTQRIGINSGDALVGNFGSRRRFNYSVMSDAVNLASRLEGANKFYGTTVIASETTAALAGDGFKWRELDTVRVKGRTQALKIFELLARADQAAPLPEAVTTDYAKGLAHWRASEFELAVQCFGRSAAADRPSENFLARAKEALDQPPAGEWDPVRTLQEK
jgi:adenylate cyclase/guanylate cyclase